MAPDLQYAVIVNQKLGFARVLINSAQSLAGDDSIPSRQTVHAYLDSAVNQLHDTIVYLLREISDQGFEDNEAYAGSLLALLRQLQQRGVENTLTGEIRELLSHSSWLQQLLTCKNNPRHLFLLFEAENKNKFSQASQISIVATDKISSDNLFSDKLPSMGPLLTLQHWLASVQNLVDRQRSHAVEE